MFFSCYILTHFLFPPSWWHLVDTNHPDLGKRLQWSVGEHAEMTPFFLCGWVLWALSLNSGTTRWAGGVSRSAAGAHTAPSHGCSCYECCISMLFRAVSSLPGHPVCSALGKQCTAHAKASGTSPTLLCF